MFEVESDAILTSIFHLPLVVGAGSEDEIGSSNTRLSDSHIGSRGAYKRCIKVFLCASF